MEAGRGAGTAGAAPVPGGARRAEAGAGAPLQKDLMVLNEVHDVMATDALASSHPLSFREEEINTPAQISEVFDSIAYSKVCTGVPGVGMDSGVSLASLTCCPCRERRCCGCSRPSSPRRSSSRGYR